jgi:pyrroloquinoline-quinone synthase
MDLFARIDAVRARRDVLAHPFYQRWSNGELTRADLALYSGQYRHAVVALARATDRAAQTADPELRSMLAEHAAEEAQHVALWDDFVAEMDGDVAAGPTPETEHCAAAWTGGEQDTLLERLVGIYAIEAAQPAISAVKADGLRTLYGVRSDAATAYFDLHAERDREHAAEGRELIERLLDGADEDALVARADAVLAANWELLDGVERATAR